jgi:protein SCO1
MERDLTMERRSFFAATTLLAGATRVSASVVSSSPQRTVGQGRDNIPNVPVTDQAGRTHHFYQDLVKGKMVVINFFYANCVGICPRMTSNLLKVQEELKHRVGDRVGRDIFMYSISLKPEEDNPKHLAEYAGMHGIKPDSGWLLLRAKRPDMELLRKRLGFKDSDPVLDADIDQHTGIVRLGSDVYDKWAASPALGPVPAIVDSLLWMDLALPPAPPTGNRTVIVP